MLRLEHPESYARAACIRTPDWKLVHRPTEVSELYDLQNDPDETDNRFNDPAVQAVQAKLLGQLLDRLILTSDVVPFASIVPASAPRSFALDSSAVRNSI